MSVNRAVNLDDLRRLARRRLPRILFDYIDGAADDELGLVTNREAFRRHHLLPRYMVDVSARDQSTELFGHRYSSPFGISPTGGISNFRHGGDLALAAAARDAGVPFIMSGAATASMEDLARVAPEHGWYQLYLAKDIGISEDMLRRAAGLGMPVLVMTVDVPVAGNRERNRRNGFGRPLRLSLGAKLDALRRPLWMKDYLRHGMANLPNWTPYVGAGADDPDVVARFVVDQLHANLTWREVEHFRSLWPGKLVLKGVLRADDALRAAEAGVDGLILSNHGGRQLERAVAPLDALPAINDAVGDRLTLMLDSGVRRGSDVVAAFCLGARFVFQGRPTLYGAIAGGQAGAARALAILKNEVDLVLGQIGACSMAELGADFLARAPEPGCRTQRP